MQTIAFCCSAFFLVVVVAEMTWPNRDKWLDNAKTLEVDYAHQMIYGWLKHGRTRSHGDNKGMQGTKKYKETNIVSAVG